MWIIMLYFNFKSVLIYLYFSKLYKYSNIQQKNTRIQYNSSIRIVFIIEINTNNDYYWNWSIHNRFLKYIRIIRNIFSILESKLYIYHMHRPIIMNIMIVCLCTITGTTVHILWILVVIKLFYYYHHNHIFTGFVESKLYIKNLNILK